MNDVTTYIEGGEPPVVYWPDFVSDPDAAFEALNTELLWTRRDRVPRDEVYFNDTPAPYTYGTAPNDRTYLPEASWHPVVLSIRAKLQMATGFTLDVCFLNRYLSAKDSLGWHADDSPEMDPDRPIVTVSLGAERAIQFRRTGLYAGNTADAAVSLEHGSAAIMLPGMQKSWQHRIPKSPVSNIGTRISLTFRGFLDLSGS